MIVILQQAERSEPGVVFARAVRRQRGEQETKSNAWGGDRTEEGLPTKLVLGGDRQEGRVFREEEGEGRGGRAN